MAEYTREDFDALLAKLKRLEPPDITDCLGLVVGYDEVCTERDTIRAELDALKAEMPKPGEAVRLILEVDAQNALGIAELCGELLEEREHLREERDTLAAELVALRAGLPRWKRDDDGLAFKLTIGPIERWVEPCANGWRAPFLGVLAQDRDTAMKVLTDSLGLPPCEVEGE